MPSAHPQPAAPPESVAVSVGLISLGCAKNLVDSQIMAATLLEYGLRLAEAPEDADVVLINTCAFIEDAREESIETILTVCGWKSQGPCRAVLVTGCLPQRYRTDLRDSLPEVDAFLGLDELESVGSVIRRILDGEQGILEVSVSPRKVFDPDHPGLVLTGGPFAYVKIAEGCNHRCAFCAIPGIRGRYRSRSIKSVLAETEKLLEAGYREINLISQDVTAYGRDLKPSTGLPELLEAMGKLGTGFWIRLLYGYPTGVTQSLLETMARTPQVCHYLDVPVQHSHPDVLRAMQRGSTVRAVHNLAGKARAVMPDIVLRTTCLVGFPGETEKRFQHLLDFVASTRFDHLGAFVFSPEDATPAFTMKNRCSRKTAAERRDRLLSLQRRIVDARARALVGTPDSVLLEQPLSGGPRRATWEGRSRRQAPDVDGHVRVTGPSPAMQPATFVDVRYTAQADYDMKAVLRKG